MYKKILPKIPLILVLLLCFWAVRPLLINGYFPMHDDTQPSRITQMAKALTDGQFPARWVTDLGYGFGYPIFNFYAPLPYYLGAIGVIGGLDLLTVTKAIFAIGMLLAGINMFILGRKIWGGWGGLVSAIFYMYAPYHAVQLYVRGAVGEVWAYACLPLVGVGVYKIYTNRTEMIKGMLIGGAGLAGVILSHNILGMLVAGCLGLGWVVTGLGKLGRWGTLGIIGIGLGLSVWFWLPALAETHLTKVNILIRGSNDYHQHFVYLDQLWNSPWGFAGSAAGRTDGMSFKIGKLHLIAGAIGLFCLFSRRKEIRRIRPIGLISLIGLAISIGMMLPISLYIWEKIPYLSFVQYPWRFLTLTSFFVSLLAGGIGEIGGMKKDWLRWVVASLVIILAIRVNANYFQPQYIKDWQESDYISETSVKWKISKISDEYLPKNFPIPQNQEQIAITKVKSNDDIIIKFSEFKSHFWKLNIFAQDNTEMVLNLAYFPGWKVVVDTHKTEPLIKDGLISFVVPKGDHIITAYFEDTWVRKVGNWVSVGVVLTLLILLTRKSYEKI